MNKIPFLELSQLATKNQNRFVHNIGLSQSCQRVYLGAAMNSLACATLAVPSLEEGQVLHAFFTEAAASHLRHMPNPYWMWTLIYVASSQAESGIAGSGRISLSDLHWAEQTLRTSMQYKFDLSRPFTNLTPGQLCSRAIKGLILLKQGAGDSDEIMFNPLFAPEISK